MWLQNLISCMSVRGFWNCLFFKVSYYECSKTSWAYSMSVKINLLIFFYMILDSDRRSHRRDLGQPSHPPLRLSIMICVHNKYRIVQTHGLSSCVFLLLAKEWNFKIQFHYLRADWPLDGSADTGASLPRRFLHLLNHRQANVWFGSWIFC